MKGDRYPENKKARNILCKLGINPYCGCANLVIARNWCHSRKYAQYVYNLLNGVTDEKVAKRLLVTAAKAFARCEFEGDAQKDKAVQNDKDLQVPDVTIDELPRD